MFIRKARKNYKCDKCGGEIRKGSYYLYQPNFYHLTSAERKCWDCFEKLYPSIAEEVKVKVDVIKGVKGGGKR